MMERTIMHVDMNAFFASVEQQANPHLQGKPVMVCGDPTKRTTVATASYEARPFGVKAGMSLYEAQKRCPQGIFIQGNPDKYVYTSIKIVSIFTQFTPLVEVFSIDEAFLDLTGTERLFGSPIRIAQTIKQKIRQQFGLTCSIGIGPNKLIAKLASGMEKPDGLVVIKKEDVPQVLEKLPVSELTGIGKKTEEALGRLGIKSCGQLGRFPEDILVRLFGVFGRNLHFMGLGIDNSPVLPYFYQEKTKSMGHTLTLQEDTKDIAVIKRHLLQLSEQVGRRLRAEKYQGRTVALTLRYSNFYTFTKRRTIERHIDDGYEIYRVALSILETVNLSGYAVRLVGVSVSNLIKNIRQLSLLEEVQKREKLLGALDQINDRYGEFKIMRATLLQRTDQAGVVSPCWRARNSTVP